jgi:hypothetical protein
VRGEAAVREVAVEADRRPERADDVQPDEQGEVEPVEGDAPEQTDRREQAERRDDDGDEGDDLAGSARARTDGSDRNGGSGDLDPP